MTITIDGTDVSDITIDGTAVTEVTIDGTVVWTAKTIIDSFEDNDVAEYSGATTEFTTPDESGLAFSAIDGSRVLEHASGQGGGLIYSTAGLPNYFSKGQQARVYVRMESAANECRVLFGLTDNNNHYMIRLDPGNTRLGIEVESGGTTSTVNSDFTASYSADTWYELTIDWQDGTGGGTNNQIVADLDEQATGTNVASVSGTDSTHASATGVGFESVSGGETFYWDDYHIV